MEHWKIQPSTCKGFGNPLLLPLPWLVVLLRGSLVILGQSALSGAPQALWVRVSTVLGWLIRCVVQGQLPHRSFLIPSTTGPDLCNEEETMIVTARFLKLNFHFLYSKQQLISLVIASYSKL